MVWGVLPSPVTRMIPLRRMFVILLYMFKPLRTSFWRNYLTWEWESTNFWYRYRTQLRFERSLCRWVEPILRLNSLFFLMKLFLINIYLELHFSLPEIPKYPKWANKILGEPHFRIIEGINGLCIVIIYILVGIYVIGQKFIFLLEFSSFSLN